MKETGLMGILFCKINCPFICFCKPSSAPPHLYSQSQLKQLENTPRAPSSTVVADSTELTGQVTEVKEVNPQQAAINGGHRSCIRKTPSESHVQKQIEKKKKNNKSVQWVDNLGQELAEIKEFESSETGDTDSEEESRHCFCIIL